MIKRDIKGVIALLTTIFLWSFMTVIIRAIAPRNNPVQLIFLRLVFAEIAFLPLIIKIRLWRKKQLLKVIGISIFSSANIFGFMFGIKHTTASASQMIYALMPINILLFGIFIRRVRYDILKIAGIFIGLIGLALIYLGSYVDSGRSITGTLGGNLIIFFAMANWTFYLLFSKKISGDYTPIELSAVSVSTSLFLSLLLVLISPAKGVLEIPSMSVLGVSIYAGIFGTFATYILYQYAVSKLSELSVSMSSYIQPVITTFIAVLILHEKPDIFFILGSVSVLGGVFLVSLNRITRNKAR